MEKENGEKTKRTLIAIDIMAIISMIRSMATDNLIGRVVTIILETTLMIKDMVMERCIGKMGPSTKEIGRWVYSMALV